MFFNNKFSFLAFILFLFLLFPTFSMSITIEEEIKESNTLIERLKRVTPGTHAADTLAIEIMQNYQCKLVLKNDKELGEIFYTLIYGDDGKGGLSQKILEIAREKLDDRYHSLLGDIEPIRNAVSDIKKTPPMDLDFGIKSQDGGALESMLTTIQNNGGSIEDFHFDLQNALNDAFIEVSIEQKLLNADPRKAFILGTTGFHPEAYRDIGIIAGETPLKEWVSQSVDVSRFKINELQKLVDDGLISIESAAQEAARGTLKDLQKVDNAFASTVDSTGNIPEFSDINKKLRELLEDLKNADNPQAIREAIEAIEIIQGKNSVFNVCDMLIDNMESALKLSSREDFLLKKLFQDLLSKKDFEQVMKVIQDGDLENLPQSAIDLRKKIFNLAGYKRTTLSNSSIEELFTKVQKNIGLENLTGNTKQTFIELIEIMEKNNNPKMLKKVLGDDLARKLIEINKYMPDKVKASLAKRLASRVHLKTLDGKWTSLEFGDSGLGADALIGIAMTYNNIDNIMERDLSPDKESRELQKAIVTNMPIVGDLLNSINKGVEAGYEGSYSKGAESAAYLVIGIAGFVPGAQAPALVAGLGMASVQIGGIAWDSYWDRGLIESWIKSGVWSNEGKLLALKDIDDNEIKIGFDSLVKNETKQYKVNHYDIAGYYKLTIRESILDYTHRRLLAGNENIKLFEEAMRQLYPEVDPRLAILQVRNGGEGLIRSVIKNAGDANTINPRGKERNAAIAIYRKYKQAVDVQTANAIEYLKSQAQKEYQARHHVGEAAEVFMQLEALGNRLSLPLRDNVHKIFSSFTSMVKEMGSTPFVIESLPRRHVQLAEKYLAGYLKIEEELKQIKEMFKMVDIKMPRHKMTGYLEIDAPRMADLEITYMNRAIIPARQEVERLYRKKTGDDKYNFNPKNADYCQLELFKKLGGILVKKVDTEDRKLLVEQFRGKLSAAETSRDKAIQDLKIAQKNESVDILGVSVPTLKALYHLGDAYESAYAWTKVRWEGTQVYDEALEILMERAEKLEEEYRLAKESGTTYLFLCLKKLPKINITFSGEEPRVSAEVKVISGEVPEESKWEWSVEGKISLIESHEDTAILYADGNGIVTVKLMNEEQVLAQVSESLNLSSSEDENVSENKDGNISDDNDETEQTILDESSEFQDVETKEKSKNETVESQSIDVDINLDQSIETSTGTEAISSSNQPVSLSGVFPDNWELTIERDSESNYYTFRRKHVEYEISNRCYVRMGATLGLYTRITTRKYIDITRDTIIKDSQSGMAKMEEYTIDEFKGYTLREKLLVDDRSSVIVYSVGTHNFSQFNGYVAKGDHLIRLKYIINGGSSQFSDFDPKRNCPVLPITDEGYAALDEIYMILNNLHLGNEKFVKIPHYDENKSLEVTLRQTSPLVGSPIYLGSSVAFEAKINDSKSNKFEILWQPHPEVSFNPYEKSLNTNAVFPTIGTYKVWAQAYVRDGESRSLVGESEQLDIEVISPKMTLIPDNETPFVGERVTIKVEEDPKVKDDLISFWWEIKGGKTINAGPEINVPNNRAYSYISKNKEKVTVIVHAKAKNGGTDLGEESIHIVAKEYKVDVDVVGPLGPKPMIWKEGKGLVEVDKEIAVHQNIRLEAKISPQPKDTDLRYEWKLNEGSHFAGGSTGSEVMVNRSQTGTAVATVTLKDKDDNVLGTGSGTFSVTISQQQIDTGKQNDEDQKKAQTLLKQGRELWKQGKLQEAIDKVENAQNLVPKDKKIIDTLKAMQKQKKDLDSKLKEAEGLIKEAKLKEAEKMLSSAALINDKYSRYKEVLQQLEDAKKKVEDEEKKIAKLLNDAKALEKVGKLDEAAKLLEDGSKQVSDNTQLTKELKEVQEQQDDAVNKMTQGQDQWEKGMIDEAIKTLTEAAKIDPSNKDVSKILKSMQLQKKTIDGLLKKSSDLIMDNKFSDAETSLKKASYINDKYTQYKEVLQELTDAKKKVEDEEKKIAKLLRDAKALEAAGKLDEAAKLLEDGSKEVSDNTQLTKALKAVQEQQADAVNKMTEGQDQWEKGMLEKAVSTLNEAIKIDPSNKQIENVLKDIQDQKTIMNNTLITADKLIKQQKFDDSKSVLKKAEDISGNYPPYIEILEKLDLAKKEAEQIIKPSTQDIDYALGFAGKWKSDYGLMEFKVDGLGVTGNYTHDKGRIEAHLSEDSKTMKGTWAEYPSYQGSNDSGKMYFKLSSDGKKIEGLWSFGDAVPSKSWNATRILDTESKTPVSGQSKEISSKGVTNNTSKSDSILPIQTSTSAVKNSIGGYWKLVNIVGDLGRECTLKEWSNSYYRHTISGNEGDVTMTKMLRKSNQTFFSARVTWQRPPEIIYPGKVIDFPLSIQKLNDTKKYSSSMSISIDTHDMKCGFARAGGRIGSLILRSGDPTTSKSKTMHWKVKEPFKKEADEKLTIRVCYSGVQICGDKDKRGWKYYYAWVPEGTSEPSSIDKHPINTISSSIDKKKDTPSSTKISSDIKEETQNYPSSTASVSSKGGGYWKMVDTIIYVNPRINNHKCYETSLKLLDGKFSYSKAQPRCTKPYRPRYTVNGSWTTPPSILIPAQKYPMKISMQGNLQDWGRGYLGIVMDDFHTKCGGATRSNKKLTDSIDVAYNKQHVNQSNDDYKAPDYGYASSKKTKKFQIKASTRDGCVRYIYEWMSADVPDNTEGKDGIVNIDKTIIKPEAAADLNIKSVVDGTENLTEVKTKTSTTYAPNTKGDVFSGGHWAGASGKSDWLQKDFTSPQLVTGVSISRASTDNTTKGFRLILKLKKENGEWISIDELHDTNINRTALSGGAVGKSIPFYRKTISPAIKATAFRLEFYGHGWFDATDIRILIMNSTEAEELKKLEDKKEKSIDRFMGTLSGSWSGKGTGRLKDWRTKGNFVMNISKKGKISGHYSGDDHGKLNGSISGSGKLNMKSGGGTAGSGTWGGSIKINSQGKLSGRGIWNADGFKGTWSGRSL